MERAESRVTWPPAHAAEACRHHGEPGTGLEQRPQSAEPTPGSWRQVSVTARDRVSTVLSRGPEALSSGGPGADPVSVGPSSARRPHSQDGHVDGSRHTSGQQGHPEAIRGRAVAVALWVA